MGLYNHIFHHSLHTRGFDFYKGGCVLLVERFKFCNLFVRAEVYRTANHELNDADEDDGHGKAFVKCVAPF